MKVEFIYSECKVGMNFCLNSFAVRNCIRFKFVYKLQTFVFFLFIHFGGLSKQLVKFNTDDLLKQFQVSFLGFMFHLILQQNSLILPKPK